MEKIKKYIIVIILLALSLIFVFSFSKQDGVTSHSSSMSLSYAIVDTIIQRFELKGFDETSRYLSAKLIECPLRKLAHFTIYMILGSIAIICMKILSTKRIHFIHIILTLLIILLIACCDEMNQLFRNGRGSSFGDVLIDFFGGIAGIAFPFILYDLSKRIIGLFKTD